MLTDTKLRNLKPQDKLYKVNDRDGFYVAVTPAGDLVPIQLLDQRQTGDHHLRALWHRRHHPVGSPRAVGRGQEDRRREVIGQGEGA